jgi:hypothetical protein
MLVRKKGKTKNERKRCGEGERRSLANPQNYVYCLKTARQSHAGKVPDDSWKERSTLKKGNRAKGKQQK